MAGMLLPAWTLAADSIAVSRIGSFYIGGKPVHLDDAPARPRVRRHDLAAEQVQPRGDFVYGQVYVHFVLLARPTARYPLLLWPGGSLTGVTYETTPDGRDGWQMNFLRAGYSVYSTDAQQGGRASWARYPEISPEEPTFRDAAFLWEIFRIGPPGSYDSTPEKRARYPNVRFPVAAFEQFARQAVPRFRMDSELTVAAYDALIERVCPCILLTHSASGPTGMDAVAKRPDLIKGLISIEPSGGVPIAPENLKRVVSVPQLIVWGDYLGDAKNRETWEPLHRSSLEYATKLRNAGASVEWWDLPERGIKGNSHLLMMDDNSAEIARSIDSWIRKTVR